ncbi:MAG TPA: hypothetical protein VKG25_24590, partial [Bryobacteraceae bacterium]|nr:hypothetical protein [Bryobacteraceae bacterium]
MSRLKPLFLTFGSLVLAGVLFTGLRIAAQDLPHRLREKAAEAQTGVRSWVEEGRDPSAILALMQQVKPALDAGDPHQAEALLDHALKMLSDSRTPGDRSEPQSDLYIRPEPVSIDGYDGSAMEPFLSPDGRYLFFNNENDKNVNTNLHFAQRTGKLSFRYLGELPGVNSPLNSRMLDAVASLDSAGHFYFTTLREYDTTMNSLYTGDFDGKVVRNL